MRAAELCPEGIVESLQRYVDHGISPGGFLCAVLDNDLKEAIGRADHINLPLIPHIVAYCHSEIPSYSWGSPGCVDRWLRLKQADRELCGAGVNS